LTDPPGLNHSAFAYNRTRGLMPEFTIFLIRTRGVLPMREMMESFDPICMELAAIAETERVK
jgi:hypothetical protein